MCFWAQQKNDPSFPFPQKALKFYGGFSHNLSEKLKANHTFGYQLSGNETGNKVNDFQMKRENIIENS